MTTPQKPTPDPSEVEDKIRSDSVQRTRISENKVTEAQGFKNMPHQQVKCTGLEKAQAWATVIGVPLNLLLIIVAYITLYQTFSAPFSPVFVSRPIILIMEPAPPNSFTVNATVWITAFNEGAKGGSIENLVLEVSLPRGKWYFDSFFFVKPDEYYRSAFEMTKDKPGSPLSMEGPFTPIYLAGRSQVTKAVMFLPNGLDDFDINLAEPGKHVVTLYARYTGSDFKPVANTSIDLSQQDLDEWKKGNLIKRQSGQNEKSGRSLLGK